RSAEWQRMRVDGWGKSPGREAGPWRMGMAAAGEGDDRTAAGRLTGAAGRGRMRAWSWEGEMKAAVFRGLRDLRLEEVPDPVCGPRDVVLEVRACGICGTDLHGYTVGSEFGPPGTVPGHEFSGRVVEVGSEVSGIATGDRV